MTTPGRAHSHSADAQWRDVTVEGRQAYHVASLNLGHDAFTTVHLPYCALCTGLLAFASACAVMHMPGCAQATALEKQVVAYTRVLMRAHAWSLSSTWTCM